MGRRVKLKGSQSVINARTTLDDDTIEAFCDLVREGLPADGVCDYMGIPNVTYWTWIKHGVEYLEGGGGPAGHAIYGKFCLMFRKATAEHRLQLVREATSRRRTRKTDKNRNNWMRALAILERRDRKTFSRKEPLGGTNESYSPDDKFL